MANTLEDARRVSVPSAPLPNPFEHRLPLYGIPSAYRGLTLEGHPWDDLPVVTWWLRGWLSGVLYEKSNALCGMGLTVLPKHGFSTESPNLFVAGLVQDVFRYRKTYDIIPRNSALALRWYSATDLHHRMHYTYSGEHPVKEDDLTTYGLLVISDVFPEDTYSTETVIRVLRSRRYQGRPTLITGAGLLDKTDKNSRLSALEDANRVVRV